MPSWLVTKSKLPKRKAWDGSKMGGTRIPTVGVQETLVSQSESYHLSPPRRGWQKNGPSDDQKVLIVQRLPHGRCQLSVQKVTNM